MHVFFLVNFGCLPPASSQRLMVGLNKGRLQKEKNVKFGLLAEIRRGRGLRGIQEPNLLSGNFLIVKK